MSRRNTPPSWRGAAVAMVLIMIVGACEQSPLEVEEASRIPAVEVELPSNAQVLVDGAIADFECAFAAYVVQSATVGEEFIYAQQTADRTPPDRRNTIPTDTRYSSFPCTTLGIYVPLQTARASADNVLRYLKVWTDDEIPNPTAIPNYRIRLIGTAAAYAGYSYLLLGEAFCTMAISSVNPDRTISYGGEISRDSVYKLAIVRFTEAITNASAGGDLAIERMAYLGRARAKLNLGDWEGARTDALQVPSGYVRNATYSQAVTRRNNFVFTDNSASFNSSSIGEPYRTQYAGDPRVPVTQGTTTSATGIRHWFQTKYTLRESSIPIARYHEAQLIIAESYIRENNLAAALPILAAFRTRGNQTPFVGVTQSDYLAELLDQRRRELFLEGHHINDIIRFGIPVQPAAGTAYHFGGTYGNQICFPLPAIERQNNPLIGA